MCFPSYSTHVSTTCWPSCTLLLIILFVCWNLFPPKKAVFTWTLFRVYIPLHTHRYVLPRLLVEVRECDLLELEEPDEIKREQETVHFPGKFAECSGGLMKRTTVWNIEILFWFFNCMMFFLVPIRFRQCSSSTYRGLLKSGVKSS